MGLTVALIWTAFGVTAGLAVVLLYLGLVQDRSRGRPRCPKCWYNMTGALSLVCPECGHDARKQRRLFRTRRRRWAILCAVILTACCYYSWLVRIRVIELKESLAFALRPTSYLLATFTRDHRAQQLQWAYDRAKRCQALSDRAERFGFWPWESQLVLLAFDSILSVNGPFSTDPIFLLSSVAKTSDRALNRLFELREHPNDEFGCLAIWKSAQHVGRLRDSQLAALLDSAMRRAPMLTEWGNGESVELILAEMVRRNPTAFREQIHWWATCVMRPPVPGGHNPRLNLVLLLTALHRIDSKPDPLHIFVNGPPVIECTVGHLPVITVGARNVDSDREPFGYQLGILGHRSGVAANWRFEVRDEQGSTQPVKQPRDAEGDSKYWFGMLQFGQSHEVRLDMNDHVRPLSPGRYRVRVLYTNSFPIAEIDRNLDDLPNLLLFSSEPFELIVKPAGADSRPASRPE